MLLMTKIKVCKGDENKKDKMKSVLSEIEGEYNLSFKK